MGYGDEIMATGMARGLHARGLKAAFGDGKKIIYSPQSVQIFWGNPNIARPGSERLRNLVWFPHYRGNRMYAQQVDGRWRWNEDFRPAVGEIFLSKAEVQWAEAQGSGFVVIESSVKATAFNKQWPIDRYARVARDLSRTHRVVQFASGGSLIPGVEVIHTLTFRHAMAALARAALYVGPEGGLHHAAAALGVRAVVIFGGFIHPKTTGYEGHVNLFSGSVACGTIGRRCEHCARAMIRISAASVTLEARKELAR